MNLFKSLVALSLFVSLMLHGAPVPYSLIVDKSTVFAKIDKSGLLSGLGFGHPHSVLATQFMGTLMWDTSNPKQNQLSIEVPISSLVIDSPKALKLANIDSGIDAEDVKEVQSEMMSKNVLDPEKFPMSRFQSTQMTSTKENSWKIKGKFEFHGVTQEINFLSQMSSNGNEVTLKGSVELDMEEFNVDAPSVAGVVNVDEDFELFFELVFRKTQPKVK